MPKNTQSMPRYRCHKEVWAIKIGSIERSDDSVQYSSYLLRPSDARYEPITVGRDWLIRHEPQVGGYYVVYEDGYKSYSSERAFEDGYAAIAEAENVQPDENAQESDMYLREVAEPHFVRGSRAAWVSVLRTCLRELGYEATETAHAKWVAERESTIATLRSACDDLQLSDVIDNHLIPHLGLRDDN